MVGWPLFCLLIFFGFIGFVSVSLLLVCLSCGVVWAFFVDVGCLLCLVVWIGGHGYARELGGGLDSA